MITLFDLELEYFFIMTILHDEFEQQINLYTSVERFTILGKEVSP